MRTARRIARARPDRKLRSTPKTPCPSPASGASAIGDRDLRQQPVNSCFKNDAEQFIASADRSQSVRKRAFFFCSQNSVNFILRNAVMVSGGFDRTNVSLINLLFDCRVTDPQNFSRFNQFQ
jgi:hypothetical protein